MKIDVVFVGHQLSAADLAGKVVAVVDVLRASTTVAVALTNGARNIIPFDSTDEVVLRSKSFQRGEVRLAGERKMLPIPGFDFGNSPREFTREEVEGKTVLFSTTNGTAALVGVQGARDVVVASYVNFGAVLTLLRTALRGGTDVAVVCAGRDRQFSLEDAACAGRYVRELMAGRDGEVVLNDAARAALHLEAGYGDDLERLFADSAHGRALADAGFTADLELCATIDAYPVIPVYSDRQITKLGPERER
ncbi:MAG TPA: 2-phosphosulfolactate phosphatase [Gemmatimonadaceae bacterium]|nr:2-phosphosulfolactate phosphatase [Gemmatimonadaceae bacterium]